MEQDPQVEQWCEKHWAPIRDSNESGAPPDRRINGMLASVYLLSSFFLDEDTDQRSREADQKQEGKSNAAKMNSLMIEAGPLCCWIGEDGVEQMYRDCTNIKSLERPCVKCGAVEFPGAWDRKKKQVVWKHMGGAWDCNASAQANT